MIYEYRIYEAAAGRMPDLHARFRDATLKLFERHGIKAVAFFSPSIGEYTDRLIYLLAFDDLGHRERAWASFLADPEWQKVKAASEAAGPLVIRIKNIILTPTDYSPLH
jgi:hypothetical protein